MVLSRFKRVSLLAMSAATALGFGVSGVASAQSITLTGPDSFNVISTSNSSRFTSSNRNDIGVNNNTQQFAESGNASDGGNDCHSSNHWSGQSNWSWDWQNQHKHHHHHHEHCEGNTIGGSAMSGDASNSASDNV